MAKRHVEGGNSGATVQVEATQLNLNSTLTQTNETPGFRGESTKLLTPEVTDIFANLESLKVSVDFGSSVGVVKKLGRVSCLHRPPKGRFFTLRPGWKLDGLGILSLDRGEAYLVPAQLCPHLCGEDVFRVVSCYGGVLRPDNAPLVWYIPLPVAGARDNDFWSSARECAEDCLRSGSWCRLITGDGHYDWEVATANWEPKFPPIELGDLLRLAFKGRVIDSLEHPVIRELRGEQ